MASGSTRRLMTPGSARCTRGSVPSLRPSRRSIAAACAVFVAASLAGCCPGGWAVLESLTPPVGREAAGCTSVSGPTLTSDPLSLVGDHPERIPDRSTAAAIAELIGVQALSGRAEHGVRFAYAAVYQCPVEGAEVGVAAVMFDEPTGAARAERLEESHMDVMFKGQLAGIVWTRGEGCDDCYEFVRARAESILGVRR
jgi:hypothetical protein